MAGFLRLPSGMLQVNSDDGTTFSAPGYMAEQLQASGVQEMPPPPSIAAPAPAPPPDMGAPAQPGPSLPISDPNVSPVAPAQSVAPEPVTTAPPGSPASAAISGAAPAAANAAANAAEEVSATPAPTVADVRKSGAVKSNGLDYGDEAAGQQSGYSQPYQGGQRGYLDKGSIAALGTSGPVGGGFGMQARTIQSQAPLTGPHREAVIGALDDQASASQSAALAGQRLIAAEAQARELANAQEMQRQKARAANVLALQKKRDDALDKIPKGIDPNAWDKSGGIGRMLAVIASGLGGYAAGMTGMQNPGIQMLQAAQRDSVEAQREEIRLAEDRGQVADNLYQKALDEFGGDPVLAENMVNLSEATSLANALEEQMSKANDDVRLAGLQAQHADVMAQIANLKAQTDGKLAQVADQYGYAPASDPLDRALKLANLDKLLSESEAIDPRMERTFRETQVMLPDGRKAWARDGASAKTAVNRLRATTDLEENFDRLEEISKMTGSSLTPAIRAEADAIVQSNKLLMKETEDLGAITSADQELVSPLAGENAAAFFALQGSHNSALNVARRHVRRRAAAAQMDLYLDQNLNTPVRGRLRSGSKAEE